MSSIGKASLKGLILWKICFDCVHSLFAPLDHSMYSFFLITMDGGKPSHILRYRVAIQSQLISAGVVSRSEIVVVPGEARRDQDSSRLINLPDGLSGPHLRALTHVVVAVFCPSYSVLMRRSQQHQWRAFFWENHDAVDDHYQTRISWQTGKY